ncbi:RNA polymerase sigma factor [Clostridium sp. Marseille-P299]|uniref:RNA polymerase sigma factor n=1 Tax=Clostridium sp. Marseille-P299 TaxID=1805477 RepID=UPI00082E8F52|nr:sigma-70 family RNA polymerase sigma factor [Clostridium sp. Marseille-P299]
MMLGSNEKKKFYAELIDSTYDKLLVYARMRVTDTSKAYDLVQDACCTAWENIDSVMNSLNPGGWLMNALKNHIHKFYDELASEKRVMDALMTDVKAETYIPDLENEITFTSILSPDEVRIIRLKEQGYKHHEIAELMVVRPGTIDSKVFRIKNKIINFLKINEN